MGNTAKDPAVETGAAAAGSDKLMQTFRMPRDLEVHLKAEASRAGRDLTAHVIRWLEGVRSYCGLPEAATALLELDRRKLEMERYEYLQHALYQRSLELREKGAGFDAPRREQAAQPASRVVAIGAAPADGPSSDAV